MPTIPSSLVDRLARARCVVVSTGAGMSAESGVPTFRAEGGLWTKFKPEELANVDAFLRNPQMVWEWYQSRRDVILNCSPNAGHTALVEMEPLVQGLTIVTQNIDGLHAAAGSTDVIELHGNIRRNFCQQCGERYDDASLLSMTEIPSCSCGGMIRPDVVWFGEMLPEKALARAERLCEEADVFISVGTSGVVYPAAGLALVAHQHHAFTVEINPEETPLTPYANVAISAAAGAVLPEVVRLLRERTAG